MVPGSPTQQPNTTLVKAGILLACLGLALSCAASAPLIQFLGISFGHVDAKLQAISRAFEIKKVDRPGGSRMTERAAPSESSRIFVEPFWKLASGSNPAGRSIFAEHLISKPTVGQHQESHRTWVLPSHIVTVREDMVPDPTPYIGRCTDSFGYRLVQTLSPSAITRHLGGCKRDDNVPNMIGSSPLRADPARAIGRWAQDNDREEQ
ncbi:uncharacterized protein CLUP02_05098 [Colletotrichum lupini]|uniref:Uncharacterized protein n=1 Tax=Colletotrichum lupini TaxID=145971 RepID=A0A9Q8SLW0_9PEZI|nr:uncharacterized protein CLUP02_05098 [Colletotrichum lupini]UQC79618.1 hypothetical protein CLUP02_05098 [Colletotrichum lupini]